MIIFAAGRVKGKAIPTALENFALWDPDSWQKYVLNLLILRYGLKEFVYVPDRHTGDFGIEGFSRDGCAYQCYAAREPLETDVLYQKQRNKMSADIRKFYANQSDLQKFLVPR